MHSPRGDVSRVPRLVHPTYGWRRTFHEPARAQSHPPFPIAFSTPPLSPFARNHVKYAGGEVRHMANSPNSTWCEPGRPARHDSCQRTMPGGEVKPATRERMEEVPAVQEREEHEQTTRGRTPKGLRPRLPWIPPNQRPTLPYHCPDPILMRHRARSCRVPTSGTALSHPNGKRQVPKPHRPNPLGPRDYGHISSPPGKSAPRIALWRPVGLCPAQ